MNKLFNEYVQYECYGNKKISFIKKIRCRMEPQFDAIYLIRKVQFSTNKRIQRYYHRKLVKKYGIFCGINSKIGKGLKLPHPNGIIIGYSVVLGENTTIYQQVTFGDARDGDWLKGNQPHAGNGCTFYAGAKIIGAITLGDNTIVGANAVLNKNTEANSTWAGIPAKPIVKVK